MESSKEFSLDSLREELRLKRHFKLQPIGASKLEFKPLGHASSLGSLSRDVSHVQDPRPTPLPSSKVQQLIKTLFPTEIALEPVDSVNIDLAQTPSETLEETFQQIVTELQQTNPAFTQEGLQAYKHYSAFLRERLGCHSLGVLLTQRNSLPNLKLALPSGRREVELLDSWLSATLQLYLLDTARPFHERVTGVETVLKCCLNELIRQVGVQCGERGQVLEKVVRNLVILTTLTASKYQMQINALHQEVQKASHTTTEHVITVSNKLKKQIQSLKAQLNSKQKLYEDKEKDCAELQVQLRSFKNRVEYLNQEVHRQAEVFETAVLAARSQKQDLFVLRKHATSQTEDSEFPQHTVYDLTSKPPVGESLILVGQFDSKRTFKKSAAYTAAEGKVIPYDFPINQITTPTQVSVGVSTSDEVCESAVELEPAIPTTIETNKEYSPSVPMSVAVGLYSLLHARNKPTLAFKEVQVPCIRPHFQIAFAEPVQVLPAIHPRTTKIRRSLKRKKRKTDSSLNKSMVEPQRLSPYMLTAQQQTFSRTSSINSTSSANQEGSTPRILQHKDTSLMKDLPDQTGSEANLHEHLEEAKVETFDNVKIQITCMSPGIISDTELLAIAELPSDRYRSSPEKTPVHEEWSGFAESSSERCQQAATRRQFVVHRSDQVWVPRQSLQREHKGVQADSGVPMVAVSPQKRRIQRTNTLSPDQVKQYSQLTENIAESFTPSTVKMHIGTTLKAFILGKKRSEGEQTHPGPIFIRNFLQYLSTHNVLHSPFPLRSLMRVVNSLHVQLLSKDPYKTGGQTAAMILYDKMLKVYGLKSVAEEKLRQVILGCLGNSATHLRVKHFSTFVGLYDPFAPEEWPFYLFMFEQCQSQASTLNKTTTESWLVLWDTAKNFLESFFSSKLEPPLFAELLSEAESLKVTEVSKLLSRSLAFETVDFDQLYAVMLRHIHHVFDHLSRQIEERLDVCLEDGQYFNFQDFREMVLAVKEVPEHKIVQHFTLYKVKEDEVELVSLNSALWFATMFA